VAGRTGVLFVIYAEQPKSAALRRALAGVTAVTADEADQGVRLVRLALAP
jgi:hypothetical protein